MLRNILFIVIVTITSALTVSAFRSCSKGCNCTETNVAVCNTLNLEPFPLHIFSLKIVNPEVPLILKGKPFLVNGLEHLNSISIDNATILEIDESAFAGVPLLNSFTVSNCNISEIGNPLAFRNATGLKTLKITNSTLKTFTSLKSSSIEELELSGCKLTEVTEDSFKGLPQLTYINLERNLITKISPLAFSSLQYLEDVTLANNNISKLDRSLFENNTMFDTLDLSNNPLKDFDIVLDAELEKLVLRSCQLERFNENVRDNLSLLSYIDLSYNKMNFSQDFFEKMTELEYVNLSGNNLTFLHPTIFQANSKLQKIVLDNNNFKEMPKFSCLAGQFDTYYFSCKNCGLTSLSPNSFKNFSALVILNLSNNQLGGNDLVAIGSLKSLIDIDLSNNNLSFINPKSFSNSTSLEKINLSSNPLTSLDANIYVNNRVLKVIDASFCKLQQLWKQPVGIKIKSLEQLNIVNNSISSITPMDLGVLPSLKALAISNNPLDCGPTLKESIVWLNEHEVSPALASPKVKTHESINTGDANKFEYLSDDLPDWKQLLKERCPFDYFLEQYERVNKEAIDGDLISDIYDDTYDEEYFDSEDEDDEEESPKYNASIENDNEVGDPFDDEDTNVDISELARESGNLRPRQWHYSILWPTLVFIFTALSVLVIVANVLLLILRTRMIPRHINMPHIKISQWSTGNKLKKHSGSVYQPLSEDKSDSYTPIITRKEPALIHNYSPKSAV